MDWQIVIDNLLLLKSGLLVTLELTLVSVLVGVFLAVIVALMRNSKYRLLSQSARIYIFSIRGTPLLVQLYLVYYGVAQIAFIRESFLWVLFSEPYFAALLALSMNTCAYGAEIIRQGIQRTAKEDIDAAMAFAFSTRQRYLYVIFPSVFRRIMPAYFNEIILMLHATSLVSTITIVDLTGVARIINSRYYAPFEAFISVGLIYLMITMTLVYLFSLIEKRYSRHLIGSSS